ncbi:MAG: crossover junction endodeoxyribonuclease RuvC [Candidatus Zixiibacteriota bacterium]
MRVLGIDPGLGITGYGVLELEGERPVVVEVGVIRSDARLSIENRLREVSTGLSEIVGQFRPEAIAVEELYSHYSHPITAVIMGHVRGVIFLKAAEAGIPVVSYAATRIKKSLTGNGRATKEQIQRMVKSTLGLPQIPEPPDAADALAIALCHCRAMQQNATVDV